MYNPTMLLRAIIAFLLLPGIAAGVVPALLMLFDGGRGAGWAGGWLILALGLAILLWCVMDFLVTGQGTLAPWDPPQHLVVVGLYRHVRNPMYVGIVTLLGGWAIAAGSPLLAGYTCLAAVAFAIRVRVAEEPWLAAQFQEEWTVYSRHVPRWLPRLKPWTGEESPD